jgi:hypothetical protein
MVIKDIKLFNSKAFRNVPKLGVWFENKTSGNPATRSDTQITVRANKEGPPLAWSLIRNEKPIVLFERHCHATEKSEAIAFARSCRSSRFTRWWTKKE